MVTNLAEPCNLSEKYWKLQLGTTVRTSAAMDTWMSTVVDTWTSIAVDTWTSTVVGTWNYLKLRWQHWQLRGNCEFTLSSNASRHYCIIEVLLCFITILICDEADSIFWSYNGSISMSHGSFSSLFSLRAEDSLAEFAQEACVQPTHTYAPQRMPLTDGLFSPQAWLHQSSLNQAQRFFLWNLCPCSGTYS